jgi:hypothetical protein
LLAWAGAYDAVFENVISEGVAQGFLFGGNYTGGGTNKLLGCIAFGTTQGASTVTPGHSAMLQDFVAAQATGPGLAFSSAANVLASNVTLWSTAGAGLYSGSSGAMTNSNSYAGSGTGFNVQGTWTVESCNAYGNGTQFSPAGLAGQNNNAIFADTTIGTGSGQCLVYVQPTSPLKNAGKSGADIGANIIYRYENGQLTTTKLWGSDGSFPCGAVYSGINDVAGSSCRDVHERLNLVAGGCPVP